MNSTSMGWHDGPREWSPRIARGMAIIEKIRKEIPEKFIIDRNTPKIHPFDRINSIHTVVVHGAYEGARMLRAYKVIFLVKIYEEAEPVTIATDGAVGTGVTTSQFLAGVLTGYERERSFWETL